MAQFVAHYEKTYIGSKAGHRGRAAVRLMIRNTADKGTGEYAYYGGRAYRRNA